MKRVLLFCMVLAGLSSCEGLLTGEGESAVNLDRLETEHWSVCGMKAPRDYQELNRFSYDYDPADENAGYVGAEADFKDGKMTLVFPSGAYKVLEYTLSEDRRSITFNAPLHHGYDGAKDVTSCKIAEDKMNIGDIFALMGYQGIKTEDSYFISFYEGSSLNTVDMGKGEWRLNFVSGHLNEEITPLHEIDCEYGTAISPVRLFDDAPAWSHDFVDALALFPWISEYDLARVYYGPAWRLPTRAEAQRLLSDCTMRRMNMIFEGVQTSGVSFSTKEEPPRNLYMESLPTAGECGFWLSDGSAFIFGYDESNKPFAYITEDTEGKSFRVLPVRP